MWLRFQRSWLWLPRSVRGLSRIQEAPDEAPWFVGTTRARGPVGHGKGAFQRLAGMGGHAVSRVWSMERGRSESRFSWCRWCVLAANRMAARPGWFLQPHRIVHGGFGPNLTMKHATRHHANAAGSPCLSRNNPPAEGRVRSRSYRQLCRAHAAPRYRHLGQRTQSRNPPAPGHAPKTPGCNQPPRGREAVSLRRGHPGPSSLASVRGIRAQSPRD